MRGFNYKKELGSISLFFLGFYLVTIIYKIFNPIDFPGLEKRILYALVPISFITVLIWLPYEKIIYVLTKNTEGLISKIERINGRLGGASRRLSKITKEGGNYISTRTTKSVSKIFFRCVYLLISLVKKVGSFSSLIIKKVWSVIIRISLFIFKRVLKFNLFILKKVMLFIRRNSGHLFQMSVNWLFQFLLIMFLGLIIFKEFFLLKFDLNYLLIMTVIFGILSIFFPYEEKRPVVATKNYVFAIIISIIGAVLISVKTRSLGWLSYVIAIISFVLIYLLSDLIYEK